jgi:RNA-directed DNA polymerase
VLEFDIKGAFDNIDHTLLLKALRKHTDSKWLLLYIERWLKVPFEKKDGSLTTREKGTPQGGVISPLLANLFFHYAFDKWMVRTHPEIPFCRYADDGLVHCRTYEEAKMLHRQLEERFQECGLMLNSEKTKIVYCKDDKRKGKFENTKFDFLSFTFRPRRDKSQYGYFIGFIPAISNNAAKALRAKVRSAGIPRQMDKMIIEIAEIWNPVIRGWIQYYGRFYKSELYSTLNNFNSVLSKWARRKYKRLKHSRRKTKQWFGKIAKQSPELFVHWKYVKPAVG